jgi:hypothetical protein
LWVCRRAPELDLQVLIAGQGDGITVRVRGRVSRATFTRDPPSTHRAREVRWLKQLRVGEARGELGADFTHVDMPRLCSESREKPTGILESKA